MSLEMSILTIECVSLSKQANFTGLSESFRLSELKSHGCKVAESAYFNTDVFAHKMLFVFIL